MKLLIIFYFALCLGLGLVLAKPESKPEAVESNAPVSEYLPPAEEVSEIDAPETKIADDGYRYKTVRRLVKYRRQRREVSQEYLPPKTAEVNQIYLPPDNNNIDNAELADDGYRYRTIRRLKYRRQRREIGNATANADAVVVNAPTSEYLPPPTTSTDSETATATATETTISPPPAEEKAEVKSAVLGNDGYRYKTVRRIRYRYRH